MSSTVMNEAGAANVEYVPVLALMDAPDVVDVAYKWYVLLVSTATEL